ncbi:MAG: PD-(D/E)XK nuclease family transposase [Leptospiraceae bacterium]|nr:PD-(D/E)XK nuclease family transposase [Leptospiraceae bacterium]MCP5511172.1 PD-(D/E)XK nuclease family transposase [Leptospiraceae bacterium]
MFLSFKLYVISKGQDYEELKKVYSINFVKHSIWKTHPEYLSTFRILENTRNFPLTDRFEIFILELKKWKNYEILPLHFKS